MDSHNEPATPSDALLDAAADRLSQTYAGDESPITEREVSAVVHESADELSDAPVQAFVPLLAENKARSVLHERANAGDDASNAR